MLAVLLVLRIARHVAGTSMVVRTGSRVDNYVAVEFPDRPLIHSPGRRRASPVVISVASKKRVNNRGDPCVFFNNLRCHFAVPLMLTVT